MTKKGWHAFGHLLKPETFGELEYRRVYQHLERLHATTEADLTVPALVADFEIQYRNKPDQLEEMRLVADYLDEAVDLEPALMEGLLKRFLQQSASMEVAKYVAENASKPDFSVATVADLAQRAVEVGERVNKTVIDLFASPLSGAPDARPTRYGLGISRELDRSLRGGTAGGELLVFLAGPSGGKTSFLCLVGAQHALAGRNVLHVSLEINWRKVVERYDQAWTAQDQETLDTPLGQAKVAAAREVVRNAGGHVWVADWSYMNVAAADVGAEIRRMRGQRCPDCDALCEVDTVIIDYLELAAPNRLPGREPRFAYKALAQEFRALARALEVPVLTAWQVNRIGADRDLITQTDTSESWDIVKIADTIVAINRNLEENRNKRARVNVVKQRESTNRDLFELYCDLDRMVVRDIELQDHRDFAVKLLGGSDAQAAPGD